MSVSWYRKWRPQSFDMVVGQDHIVQTLRHALAQKKINHAYLFTGPRGVGKTTVARLLAKGVNCQNPNLRDGFSACGKCGTCVASDQDNLVDVVEIDAASNRGIDDIRSIRDKISLAPVFGAYRVYIIDEVHMLTKEAFNALLKTLEEPPGHVIIIMATTEIAKVPATIISRCQRFDFRPISEPQLAKHLQNIATTEKVELTDEGAAMLAAAAAGSGRDAVSLLQQVSITGQKLDQTSVSLLLGFVPDSQAEEMLMLCRGQSPTTLGQLNQILEKGIDPETYIRTIMRLIAKAIKGETADWAKGLTTEQLLAAADEWAWALRQIKGHPEAFLVLATAVIGCGQHWNSTGKANNVHLENRKEPSVTETKTKAPVVEQAAPKVEIPPQTLEVKTWHPGEDEAALWQKFVESAKPFNHSLAALLKDATLLGIEPGDVNEITVGVKFPFHRGRLMEIRNRKVLEDILKDITGQTFKLTCTLLTNQPNTVKNASSDEELLQAAKEMFGEGS